MTSLEDHFGLTQPPFPRAAVDGALFRHPGVDDVMSRLRFALARDTIALLVAESGSGKSTTLGLFARSLDVASFHLISVSLTTVGPFGFFSSLCAAGGIRSRRFKAETAAAFLAHLRGLPKRTLILVDEAHLLPDASLEDLRLLTADDLDRGCPFSLVLAGQPLLRERIGEPQHYALSQRIGVRARLRPLTENEVSLFLDRHLKAAGAKKSIFDLEAIAVIFQHSRGIPRPIQNIALQSMLTAQAAGKKTIDAACVQQAAVDMAEL